MRTTRYLTLIAGLAFLALPAAQAQTTYKIEPIVAVGDTVTDLPKQIATPFVGTLNDAGQLVFLSGQAGPLLQLADGKITPIAIGGGDAPGGKWSASLGLDHVVSMNQRGNVVFSADARVNDKTVRGNFLWDLQTRKVTALTLPGMPATGDLVFAGAPGAIPAINNRDEIALGMQYKDAAGLSRPGLFFRGQDGKLAPIFLTDQELSGGDKGVPAGSLTINEAGTVGFLVDPKGVTGTAQSAYLWEQGTVTPVAVIGQEAPGGGQIERIAAVRVNNKDRSVLVAARVSTAPTRVGIYRWVDGKLQAVAVPGQEMHGGGKLQSVMVGAAASGLTSNWYMSRGNELGQIAFLARLEDQSRAVYQVDAEGKLSLIVKEGATTERGTITRIQQESGVGLNSKGQVALVAKLDNGPDTLFLLTPTTP